MNYERIYHQIINNRLKNEPDGYTEIHHIKPRCLGGSDEVENLVKLTAREHFICHYLLTKMYPDHYGLSYAFVLMKAKPNENSDRYINSYLYEKGKLKFSKKQRKNMLKSNPSSGTMWIKNDKLKHNQKINVNDEIPDGWIKGRCMNYEHIKKDPICNECGSSEDVYKSGVCKVCCYEIHRINCRIGFFKKTVKKYNLNFNDINDIYLKYINGFSMRLISEEYLIKSHTIKSLINFYEDFILFPIYDGEEHII